MLSLTLPVKLRYINDYARRRGTYTRAIPAIVRASFFIQFNSHYVLSSRKGSGDLAVIHHDLTAHDGCTRHGGGLQSRHRG
jgi:hypothetical protein